MAESVRERSRRVFAQSSENIIKHLDYMLREQSSKGCLKSGSTIKQAVQIFHGQSSEALGRCLDSAANRIDQRGWRWRSSLREVRSELDKHIASAPSLLRKTLLIAEPDKGPDLAQPLLKEVGEKLHTQLHDFAEGWTAPKGKNWIERHPFWYSVFMIAIGVILSQVGEMTIESLPAWKDVPAASPSSNAK
jgi:hypothetical protein